VNHRNKNESTADEEVWIYSDNRAQPIQKCELGRPSTSVEDKITDELKGWSE